MLDFLILSPSFAVPVWEFLSPLMPVVNSGTLSLTIESLLPIRRRRLIVDDNLTIGVIVLRQSSHIYITARLTIVSFSTELDPSICAAFEDILEEMPSGLDPCPCTEMGALADTNFQESSEFIDFFHEGSSICFRSATPSSTNSGQQCCYTDGIINLEIGAGTADTYSPNFNIALHFTYDVLPWFACCYLTNNCGYYSSARPADDCSAYESPFVANTQGDPHFTTLDGLQYTFNGAGEFTLAISPLYNFTFQARMEIYLNTGASVYTAFAIQTHNSSKIQLQRNILNQTLIFIDNESFQLKDGILLKRIANGVTLRITEDFSQVNVQFNSGVSLRIYLFSEFMSFLLQLIDIFKGNMEGLLGNFNGDTSDDLTSPDGSSILTNSTLSQIHYEFGLEWMISESDSIFSYQTPFDYNTYSIPLFSTIIHFTRSRTSEF
ncbi:Protein mesh-like [Oopsacas minuta]|uniref:Protein mesh-like n=1 Tax=Oopsacas minuta TaxID=111878 RepID=A0AAV7JYN8_9METZ|nr:Protein mesh-like [Oopsacas minuta]